MFQMNFHIYVSMYVRRQAEEASSNFFPSPVGQKSLCSWSAADEGPRENGKGLGEIRERAWMEKYGKRAWRNTGFGRVKRNTKEENRGNVPT